jgi:hypothetical protein
MHSHVTVNSEHRIYRVFQLLLLPLCACDEFSEHGYSGINTN